MSDDSELSAEDRAGARADAGRQGEYRVELPEFEGPLDLLLHLIQKHELDILTLPIAFIAERYVEYIRKMEELSIDLASEYLVMAATLVHLKSRMLLPPDPTQADEDELNPEEEDPRAELIRRLLEYQKYKQAAGDLIHRSVLGRDVFARGSSMDPESGLAPLMPISLFRLMDAFEAVLQRAKQVEDHLVDFERISISEKISQISDLLRERQSVRFEELFQRDESRSEMIVTFLALLEMTKLRMTHLRQDGPLEPIFVDLAVREESFDEFGDVRANDHDFGSERGLDEDGFADEPLADDELDASHALGADDDDVSDEAAFGAASVDPDPEDADEQDG